MPIYKERVYGGEKDLKIAKDSIIIFYNENIMLFYFMRKGFLFDKS